MDRPNHSKRGGAVPAAAVSFIAYPELPYPDLALRDPALPTPTLDRSTQDRIGRELRAMYAAFERQPIPQHLLDLLGALGQPKE